MWCKYISHAVYQKKKPSDVSKPDLTQRITCSSYSMRTVRVFSVQEVKIRVSRREGRAGSRSSQWHAESPVSWCQSTSASGGPSADEMMTRPMVTQTSARGQKHRGAAHFNCPHQLEYLRIPAVTWTRLYRLTSVQEWENFLFHLGSWDTSETG